MTANNETSNWIEVDTSAIENNVHLIKSITQTRVMAVVKSNAYGHGTLPVAEAALRGGAEYLGVARIEEALQLREAGVTQPILVMGYTPANQVNSGIIHNTSLTVWKREQISSASIVAQNQGLTCKLHLKIDTGMSRLGAQPEEALDLAAEIYRQPGIELEGVFTHYARADEQDQEPTVKQERLFKEVVENLDSAGLRPPLVHAANSAAVLSRQDSYFDLVRPGIAIYGLHPSPEHRLPDRFRPALEWKSVLSQVKQVPAGRGVSYGHDYITRSTELIGTVPVGYADGYRRTSGNRVLVGGRIVPVIGRVCMDQISVQLDSVPDAREGDEVVLIGDQGEERISAEDLAHFWGTINYEVVCGLGSRVPRRYK